MASKKHYILVSITLGAIAAVAAGVIGLTNLVTKDRIAENEQKRIQAGIVDIFGENAEIVEEFTVKNQGYVVYGYQIKNDESELDKYALRTTGSNSYGKVSLLVGVSEDSETHDFDFTRLSVIVNEQTYASTLEDEYLDPLNDGGDINDVNCGATYGAKLVREMINQSIDYANTALRGE